MVILTTLPKSKPPSLEEIIQQERNSKHQKQNLNEIEDDDENKDLPLAIITPHKPLKYPAKVKPDKLLTTNEMAIENIHHQNTSATYPGVKFFRLQDNLELKIFYHNTSNLIGTNYKYVVLVANEPRHFKTMAYIFSLPIACLRFEAFEFCFI